MNQPVQQVRVKKSNITDMWLVEIISRNKEEVTLWDTFYAETEQKADLLALDVINKKFGRCEMCKNPAFLKTFWDKKICETCMKDLREHLVLESVSEGNKRMYINDD